jgi:FkbM family methyltransferase
MTIHLALIRAIKLWQTLKSKRLVLALFQHRVLCSAEHRHVLVRDLATIIDIGANRGQFALACREWAANAKVKSFEPLSGPAKIYRKLFASDPNAILYESAIGLRNGSSLMHISARDDSSSLLPIAPLQTEKYPGTDEVGITEVRIAPLSVFLGAEEILAPAMLKLDVQGYELEALAGCEPLLRRFEWVYCECSFVELYSGQKMAHEVIEWLSARGFVLFGVFNTSYDADGQAIQADFLFRAKQPQ